MKMWEAGMQASSIVWLGFALGAGVVSAQAQALGTSSGLGTSSSGGSGIQSSITGSSAPGGSWPPSPWPPSLGNATNVVGSERGSTQQRATEGSSSVSSANADAVARSGNFGAATTIGGRTASSSGRAGSTFQSIAGTGPESLYNIPSPIVSVDLDGIRKAVKLGPNATPDSRGN
ncbi:hypothetical protein [Aureimonas sp. AU40]|uniref:hypothetical protein n=1 Tax=Aureimonas sp. AU40 TaxID=1637747 RepID=UPI0012E38559|nr:hypothetical protein [Aureimonas sp. AU40]